MRPLKGVSHDLTKFLRASAEGPPRQIPELDGVKPSKYLMELYESFWVAAAHVAPAERAKRLGDIESQLIVINNTESLQAKVKDFLKLAIRLEEKCLKLTQDGYFFEYTDDKSSVADCMKEAKKYNAAALFLRAMAWYVYETFENPHCRGE